jgi:hypothetical protein
LFHPLALGDFVIQLSDMFFDCIPHLNETAGQHAQFVPALDLNLLIEVAGGDRF